MRAMLQGPLALNGARPLAAHALFASRDLDEARDKVAAVFCPHRLETIGKGASLDARHHHLAGERLSLNYIEYGARTLIAPGALETFYLVQIPLSGRAAVVNGKAQYLSDRGQAAVLNPHRETTMIWEEGTGQLLLQIDRKALMGHLAAQLGHPADRPLSFDGPLDVTSGAGAALRRLLLYLVAEADQGACPLGQGMLARQVETTLMAGLLEASHHDYAADLGRSRALPRPRHMRLAEGYIEAHLSDQITVEDVAQAAGISVRGLQLAFRDHRGTSPLGFWRDLRLQKAHEALMAGEGSVTDVALKWGFGHFGRFSQMYRMRYGLTPSRVLRSARGSDPRG
jgi:AraC-like DNA-binding protein